MMEKNFELTDYAELWRPQYHYSALDGQLNDPNGLVYYKGVYHLYYQSIPHSRCAGNPRTSDYYERYRQAHPHKNYEGKHWAHATSTDLIHWKEEEIALFPDDVGHMWSGTAVVDVNNTSGFFTNTKDKQGIVIAYSTNTQHIGIAYSTDDGKTFTKVSTTVPVIKNPGICAFRDPHIFWHEETNCWKMVVCGKGGRMWIYQANDLVHWELCSFDEHINTECPNLFRMTVEETGETKWIFMCVGRGYYVGHFDGTRFIPESEYIALNEGPDAYAGITFSNLPNGRTVMINWIGGYNTVADGKWNGCFTLPVELKLVKTDSSYRIMQSPVREFSALKNEKLVSIEKKQYQGGEDPLRGVCSNCFELYAEIDVKNSDSFSIAFCKGEGEEILLRYDKSDSCISFDRHNTKFAIEPFKTTDALFSFYVDPKTMRDGLLSLRLLVDVSNIELFVNEGYYYFVSRIQPFTSSRGMSLSYDGVLTLNKLTVESCRSIWFADGEPRGAVHVSDDSMLTVKQGCTNNERMVAELCGREVQCSDFDASIAKVEVEGNTLKVTGISEGKTSVKLYSGEYYRILNITVIPQSAQEEVAVYKEAPIRNIVNFRYWAAVIQEYSGRINAQKMGGERGVTVVENEATDVSICAKMVLFGRGAVGVSFRLCDNINFLCAEIDAKDGAVRLWKNVEGKRSDIAVVQKEIAVNTQYELRIEAVGQSIKVYLDNVLVIEGRDDVPIVGRIGIMPRICDVIFDEFVCSSRFYKYAVRVAH